MRFSTLIGIFAGSQAFTSGSPVPEPENKPAVLHKRDMCTMRAERNFVPIDGFGYYSEFWLEYVGGHLISKLNMYSDPSAGGGLTIRASDSHLPNDGFWRASGKGSGFDGCSFDFEGQGHRGYTYERDNGWVAGCAVDFGCEGGRGLVGIEASADLVTREIEPVVDAIAEPAILAKRDMCTLRGEVLRFYQRGKGYQYSWSMWLDPALHPKDKNRPLLVNFHGGGFTIGHARDDARWATAVTSQTDAVVVSVNYRLAPEHPFPVAIDDCVSAILWLWRHADEFGIDISRTSLSGFSAGGNLTYAVSIRLYEVLTTFKREDGFGGLGVPRGNVVSLVVFYGSTDWTQTRAEREDSNPELIRTIPPRMFRLFDEAYLSSKPDMRSPFLSPGLAEESLLKNALPERLALVNCSGDQLLAESERFRARLLGLGKKVDGCVVEGVGHGWDKKPTFRRGDAKRDEAYRLAVESLGKAWAGL
ncbi:hypothetical protein IFR05_011747 [Cadophora sp. M221]|nr:hypothetical protein IFR05_011747 [Cadophora sp. M221]